jgi:hypothetical protein
MLRQRTRMKIAERPTAIDQTAAEEGRWPRCGATVDVTLTTG